MKKVIRPLIYLLLDTIAFVQIRLNFAGSYLKKEKISHLNMQFLSKVKSRGKIVRLNGRIFCSGAKHLELGENDPINNNAYFRAEGGLYIGDNAHFSRTLTICTVNHAYTEGGR